MKKRKLYAYAVALACLLTACGSNPKNASTEDGLAIINVETAVNNLQELKLSQLGNRVRYVPLETGDSCFIGRYAKVKICGDYIIVASSKQAGALFVGDNCLSFDKKSGQFVTSIGHVGQDPQGYSQIINLYYNEQNGLLYFERTPNQLQKYDLQGRYHGHVTIPTESFLPPTLAFGDSVIIGHYCYGMLTPQWSHSRASLIFARDGQLTDSINTRLPLPNLSNDENPRIVLKTFGQTSFIINQSSQSTERIYRNLSLWTCQGEVRFKEDFSDTIYNIKDNRLQPLYVFQTGQWHFPTEAITDGTGNSDKILTAYALETPQKFYFVCLRDLYGDKTEVLHGIYDKQTGTTLMGPEKDGLTDDINGFLPFCPESCNDQGEYVALVWPEDILPWLDEHPEAKDNPALAPLLKIEEEDNPVAIIVTQE